MNDDELLGGETHEEIICKPLEYGGDTKILSKVPQREGLTLLVTRSTTKPELGSYSIGLHVVLGNPVGFSVVPRVNPILASSGSGSCPPLITISHHTEINLSYELCLFLLLLICYYLICLFF